MGIRYVWLCQAVAAAKKDLVVFCNGYQVCVVIQSSSRAKDLLVVHNGYQVCGGMPSSSSSKVGLAGGL